MFGGSWLSSWSPCPPVERSHHSSVSKIGDDGSAVVSEAATCCSYPAGSDDNNWGKWSSCVGGKEKEGCYKSAVLSAAKKKKNVPACLATSQNVIACSSPTSLVNLFFVIDAAVTSPQQKSWVLKSYKHYSVHHLVFQRTNSPSLTLFLFAHRRAVNKSNKVMIQNVYMKS